jgi:hypothetical protein
MRREPRPRPARAAPALPATTGGARLCRALSRTCSRVRACRSGSPPTSPNSSIHPQRSAPDRNLGHRETTMDTVAAVYIYDPRYRGGVGIGRDGEAARLVRRARELSRTSGRGSGPLVAAGRGCRDRARSDLVVSPRKIILAQWFKRVDHRAERATPVRRPADGSIPRMWLGAGPPSVAMRSRRAAQPGRPGRR